MRLAEISFSITCNLSAAHYLAEIEAAIPFARTVAIAAQVVQGITAMHSRIVVDQLCRYPENRACGSGRPVFARHRLGSRSCRAGEMFLADEPLYFSFQFTLK